eukprot:TRINITY_DN78214_c0_g1_i1.p1 TRINITY_DN78214_c0_g1~~TRINITY_DN78214_c0_g1_i1.p1  ORF type:complete len:129 (-),score=5.63 TRINITY_DN78214_c0_g1_i1:141-506(-)
MVGLANYPSPTKEVGSNSIENMDQAHQLIKDHIKNLLTAPSADELETLSIGVYKYVQWARASCGIDYDKCWEDFCTSNAEFLQDGDKLYAGMLRMYEMTMNNTKLQQINKDWKAKHKAIEA